ncbi:hypothetical protein F5Y14DRAFT_457165 [Nemania sp. NC0429]|nr:hypothetical protein F5Y14DRAFT_457165 [Nemania sp. NC0429]
MARAQLDLPIHKVEKLTVALFIVVKNPLSPVEHKGGEGVRNEMFELGLDKFIRGLMGKTPLPPESDNSFPTTDEAVSGTPEKPWGRTHLPYAAIISGEGGGLGSPLLAMSIPQGVSYISQKET